MTPVFRAAHLLAALRELDPALSAALEDVGGPLARAMPLWCRVLGLLGETIREAVWEERRKWADELLRLDAGSETLSEKGEAMAAWAAQLTPPGAGPAAAPSS